MRRARRAGPLVLSDERRRDDDRVCVFSRCGHDWTDQRRQKAFLRTLNRPAACRWFGVATFKRSISAWPFQFASLVGELLGQSPKLLLRERVALCHDRRARLLRRLVQAFSRRQLQHGRVLTFAQTC